MSPNGLKRNDVIQPATSVARLELTMAESENCHLVSLELIRKAESNEYEGDWSRVAIAAAIYKLAAAVFEAQEHLTYYLNKRSLTPPPPRR